MATGLEVTEEEFRVDIKPKVIQLVSAEVKPTVRNSPATHGNHSKPPKARRVYENYLSRKLPENDLIHTIGCMDPNF